MTEKNLFLTELLLFFQRERLCFTSVWFTMVKNEKKEITLCFYLI